MLINEPKQDLESLREIKVKIPIAMHIRLHSMKVLTGKQISEAVTDALRNYLEANRPTHRHALVHDAVHESPLTEPAS
jgi:hypothetical protein